MDNVLTEQQRKDSWLWLFAGGAFAVFVTGFVIWSDRTLSTSDHEQKLGATLKEIRSAQVSVPSAVDPRQLGALHAEKRLEELATK